MLNLKEVFFYLVLTIGYLEGKKEATGDSLSSEHLLWKFDILVKDYTSTANVLRNITVDDTRASRVQLSSMVTTYVTDLMSGLSELQVTVANTFDQDGYSTVSNVTIELQNYINSIQSVIYEQPDVLKEKLASYLAEVTQIVSAIRDYISCHSELNCNQFDYSLNIISYGLIKLKQQALHFKETNKQISARISTSIAEITEDMQRFARPQKRVLVYLRHFGTLQEVITLAIVDRMQKWIELNSQDTKNVEIAEEVINVMTDLIKREALAVRNLRTLEKLKAEQISIYVTGVTAIQKLGKFELAEDSAGYDYIRSTLMDAISVPVFVSKLYNDMPKD